MTEQTPLDAVSANPEKEKAEKSVWQSPTWIIAIAGLLGVVFSLPPIAISYFQTQAEIERQRMVTRGTFIDKALDTNTLEDRMVVLRWLKLSGIEKNDQSWAESEIAIINDYYKKVSETETLRVKVRVLEGTLGTESEQYQQANQELKLKTDELAKARSQVGSLSNEVIDLKKQLAEQESMHSYDKLMMARIGDACDETPRELHNLDHENILSADDPRVQANLIHKSFRDRFCFLGR